MTGFCVDVAAALGVTGTSNGRRVLRCTGTPFVKTKGRATHLASGDLRSRVVARTTALRGGAPDRPQRADDRPQLWRDRPLRAMKTAARPIRLPTAMRESSAPAAKRASRGTAIERPRPAFSSAGELEQPACAERRSPALCDQLFAFARTCYNSNGDLLPRKADISGGPDRCKQPFKYLNRYTIRQNVPLARKESRSRNLLPKPWRRSSARRVRRAAIVSAFVSRSSPRPVRARANLPAST